MQLFGFVIKSLDNLLIYFATMQTEYNIISLTHQRICMPMYEKTVRIFDLEFLFSNCSCKDYTETILL